MTGLSSISDLIKRATDSGDVPGVAVSVANADGVLFEAASGVRDLDSRALMGLDTVVRIASMTKAVTGAAAMQLVEQGKLDLDGPIGKLLPGLGSVQVFEGFDASGKPRLRAPKRPVTLRHLLTHTSGHTYDTWNALNGEYRTKTGMPAMTTGKLAALDMPLLFDPGEKWEYGIGIDWAGRAIEEAAGLKLDDYMKQNLFDPLGMADTGFRTGDSQRARLAALYLRKPEGLTPFDRGRPEQPEFDGGGGGLLSTVKDYTKFTQMILRKGEYNGARVLKPATVELMSKNAMGAIDTTPLPAVVPHLTNAVDITDGMKWGLTFMINEKRLPTGRSPGSLAWGGLMNSYYWIDPAKGIAGVYATQILPFCDVKSLKLFQDFETAVYEAV